MKLTTLIGAQELDVLVAPEEQFNHYTEMEAFFPMDEILTEEEKEAYGDAVTEYGICIGNTEKLQEFQTLFGTALHHSRGSVAACGECLVCHFRAGATHVPVFRRGCFLSRA